jgi:hypothetical protein
MTVVLCPRVAAVLPAEGLALDEDDEADGRKVVPNVTETSPSACGIF